MPNPGGLQVDLGVDSSMSADSNFQLTPGNGTGPSEIWDTTLAFGLSSITQTSDFWLGASTVLRFASIPGRDVAGFEDPKLRLRYVTNGYNSRFTLTGSYRNVDREFLNPFQVEQEEQTVGTLVADGGNLIQTIGALRYETGLNSPVGFVLDLDYDDEDYQNVLNNTLFPNTNQGANAVLSFDFSPVTTVNFQTGYLNYSALDSVSTDRTTQDYSIGLVHNIDAALTFDAQIGYSTVETDTINGTTSNDNPVGTIGLTKVLPNGNIFGTLTTTNNQNGWRNTLLFGRDMLLPSGQFAFTFGATDAQLGDPSFVGSLVYTHQLGPDTLAIAYNQSVSTNNNNENILDTRLGIDYNRAINSVSSWLIAFDWARSEDTGGTGAPTINLASIGASYLYDINNDWTLSTGIDYTVRQETGMADANSAGVFVNLGRGFSYRP